MSTSSRNTNQHLLIKSLVLQNGDPVEVGTITVFVGPHNSGKTETLRDILRLVAQVELSEEGQPARDTVQPVVLRDVSFVGQLTVERLTLGLKQVEGETEGETLLLGIGPDLSTPLQRRLAADIKNTLYRPMMTASAIAATALGEVMPLRIVYLDERRRLQVLSGAPAGSPSQAAESLLQLLQDAPPSVHDDFDEAFAGAFAGLHVRLDETQRIRLELRVANQFPASVDDPLTAVQQFGALGRLDQQGAGAQSFAAPVLTMLLLPGRVVLLDHAEGQLHDDQARRLGAWISDHAARLSCQVFLTSRNVSFLSGLYAGAADVSMVRLERRQDTTRMVPIAQEVSAALARHPLLTSQDGIDCVFAEGIVLVPEDTDRLVYESVAGLIHSADSLRFLHSYGLANLRVVAEALRRTGLPLCVVAELDVLSDDQTFIKLVKALTGSEPPQPWLATRERLAGHVEGWFDERSLSSSAHEVENYLDQLKEGDRPDQAPRSAPTAADRRAWQWNRLKQERLEVLPPELRTWVEDLLEDLRHIGLFVSPKGNTRAWMSDMLTFEGKQRWLLQSLEALRSQRCPNELQAFVAAIVAHLRAQRLPSRAARTGQGA